MKGYDFIVVGSGVTGAIAAQRLIERGASVLMLDVGIQDKRYDEITACGTFDALRREQPTQHHFLLGDDLEALEKSLPRNGGNLTPPRHYITRNVDEILGATSGFHAVESLAFGGLGSGWGLGCSMFSDEELMRAGLSPAAMRQAYQDIVYRVGISGSKDDAAPYTIGQLEGVQPSAAMGPVAAYLYGNYRRRKQRLNGTGFYLGRPGQALLTKPIGNRSGTSLRDMDFYSDAELAAWRPWIVVNELKTAASFEYAPNHLVERFSEDDLGIRVEALEIGSREHRTFRASQLVLASGVFGTARIVLRSAGAYNYRLPLLTNAFSYTACVVPRMFGKTMPEQSLSVAHLLLFHDADGANRDVAMASIYPYRSLLLFRLLRETPLNFADARILLQYMLSGMFIVAPQYPDEPSANKGMALVTDPNSMSGDRLDVDYSFSAREHEGLQRRQKQYNWAVRALGALPLRTNDPGVGSSIHYAGSLPFSQEPKPFSVHPSGRLHGHRRVFVADGSGFNYLSGKGITFSLMANALSVANAAHENVLLRR